jgi:hypothetical protein
MNWSGCGRVGEVQKKIGEKLEMRSEKYIRDRRHYQARAQVRVIGH